MEKTYNYINIREVLSRVLRHPLLQDVTIEQVIQYTIDFIGIFGLPKLYIDKEAELHIESYRALLPCDCVDVNQVKDCKTDLCLRGGTGNFEYKESLDYDSLKKPSDSYFKIQGTVIFTSFETGDIKVSYKAIPLDEDGFPLLIDNPVFLKGLELYIKREVFTILFDQGKISQVSLQNTQQQYAWAAGQVKAEFTIPTQSEMESLKRMWTTFVPRVSEFNKGFKTLGSQEYIKLHR